MLEQSAKLYLKSPAARLATTPPTSDVESDSVVGLNWHLTLAPRSPRAAANLKVLLFSPKAGDIKHIWVNDESLETKAQETTRGPAVNLPIFGLPITKKLR